MFVNPDKCVYRNFDTCTNIENNTDKGLCWFRKFQGSKLDGRECKYALFYKPKQLIDVNLEGVREMCTNLVNDIMSTDRYDHDINPKCYNITVSLLKILYGHKDDCMLEIYNMLDQKQ